MKTGLLLLGATILALVVFGFCHHRPDPVSHQVRKTLDSLAITKPTYDSAQRESARAESSFVVSADTAHAHAQVVIVHSQADKRRADSLAAVARTLAAANGDVRLERDAWKGAYEAADRRGDSLSKATDSLDHAFQSERLARLQAVGRANRAEARAVSLDDLNKRIERDIQRAASCKVLWVVPCATRVQSFAVGAASGVLTDELVVRPALKALTTRRD